MWSPCGRPGSDQAGMRGGALAGAEKLLPKPAPPCRYWCCFCPPRLPRLLKGMQA